MKDFIRERFRQIINEIAGVKYSYGCVMLYFDIPKDKWKKIQDLVNDEDISEVDGVEGRETEPHITLLYGIHEDVDDKAVEAIINEFSAPEISLSKIGIFENEDMDVVKFDIKCKELNKMNKQLKELPHTSKFPTYEAHSTIAFVKAGRGKDYKQTLDKDDELILKPTKIVYSKPDGTKNKYNFKK